MLSCATSFLREVLLRHCSRRPSLMRSITTSPCSASNSNVLNYFTGFPSGSVCSGGSSYPMEKFYSWLQDAISRKIIEPSAMCLTTVVDNKPSARYVIMREYNEDYFTFYTNSNSLKGLTLAHNSHAAATFQWLQLQRSVNIEGIVEKFTEEENDVWFKTVPNSRKLMYWNSNQSEVVDSVATMISYEQQLREKFADATEIPRPPHWSGYKLIPHRITFLSGDYLNNDNPSSSGSVGGYHSSRSNDMECVAFEKQEVAKGWMEWVVTGAENDD